MTEQERVAVLNKLGIFSNYQSYMIVDKGDEYEVFSGYPDIKGCILVGYGYADLDGDGLPEIVRSKDAFKALMLACPNGFELTIK